VVAVDNSAAIAWQRKLITRAREGTWKCQDSLGISRTKAGREAATTTSIPRLLQIKALWRARAKACWKESANGGAVRHKLGDGLRGTPLAGSEHELEEESRRANFNPYVIVGASGVESSFGAAACHGNPNNIWGLGACGRAWHEPYFATRREAYRYFIKFIRSHWPSAKTIYEFYGYCVPASRCGAPLWGARAMDKARQLFGPVSPSQRAEGAPALGHARSARRYRCRLHDVRG
jgi:hypothetical protein